MMSDVIVGNKENDDVDLFWIPNIEEIRTTGNVTETLKYYYDSSDNIIGFTYNGEKYLYLKNIQKDNRNKFLYRNNWPKQ